MSKDMDFCYLEEIYFTNMEQIIRYCYKTGLDAAKNASKK